MRVELLIANRENVFVGAVDALEIVSSAPRAVEVGVIGARQHPMRAADFVEVDGRDVRDRRQVQDVEGLIERQHRMGLAVAERGEAAHTSLEGARDSAKLDHEVTHGELERDGMQRSVAELGRRLCDGPFGDLPLQVDEERRRLGHGLKRRRAGLTVVPAMRLPLERFGQKPIDEFLGAGRSGLASPFGRDEDTVRVTEGNAAPVYGGLQFFGRAGGAEDDVEPVHVVAILRHDHGDNLHRLLVAVAQPALGRGKRRQVVSKGGSLSRTFPRREVRALSNIEHALDLRDFGLKRGIDDDGNLGEAELERDFEASMAVDDARRVLCRVSRRHHKRRDNPLGEDIGANRLF